MKNLSRTFILTFIFTIAVSFLGASSAFCGKSLRRSFAFEPGKSLTIKASRCDIQIEGSNRDGIEVYAEFEEDIEKNYKLEFEPEAGGLTIIARALEWQDSKDRNPLLAWLSWNTNWPGENLNLKISVPYQVCPQIENSRGRIEINSIQGDVSVDNSRADILCSNIDGPVSAHNSRAAVELTRVKGRVEVSNSRGLIRLVGVSAGGYLENSKGDIEIESATGEFEFDNTRGNIQVSGLNGAVTAQNSRGDIVLLFAGQPTGNCDISTERGNIEVRIPPDIRADLSASSHRGKICCDIPLQLVGEMGGDEIEGTLAGGGPKLTLSCSRGEIRITQAGL